jgi:cyclopropane fatty-acyl-phospholipid synthase-like methyltransferase
MENISTEQAQAFGNPTAYKENKLYHIFANREKEDLFYSLVLYGLNFELPPDIKLDVEYNNLLLKLINYQQNRVNRIVKQIKLCNGPSIWLDLGCGVGQFLFKILQADNHFVVGTDISLNAIKKAKSLVNKNTSKKHFALVNQDKTKLPLKDKIVDYILSADVMEHVGYGNQKEIISEMHRVLKKGGKAIIHTPNRNRVFLTTIYKKIYFLFKGFNPLNINHSFPRDHISLTTAGKLKKISTSVGFVVSIYYQTELRMPKYFWWILAGLNVLFSRTFILVLTKK